MSYTKTVWEELPSTNTPINADNLNNIENGIKDNDDMLNGNAVAGNMIVEGIRTKNMFDGSTFANGDIIRADKTLRLSSRQALWLETGTYTFSTNMTSSFRFNLLMETVGPPPLTAYPTYTYASGWQTATGTSTLTFTVSTAGWFVLLLSKVDNSVISQNEKDTILSFNYQLEKGTTASVYTPYQNLKYMTPTVLFDTTTAVSPGDTLNLSDNVNNYEYIEIFYNTTSSVIQFSQKLATSINNNLMLSGNFYTSGNHLQPFAILIQISGSVLTVARYGGVDINTSNNTISSFTMSPRIFKIVGYKQ